MILNAYILLPCHCSSEFLYGLCRVKASSYIIHIADYILFQSFEIRGYILNNKKILIGLIDLDSFF